MVEVRSGTFTTTHWSWLRKLGATDPAAAATALEQLCRAYWFPIYAFLRHQRNAAHHEAEDLTQGFFAHLLERQAFQRAAPDRGRFRNFLLGALKHYLANEWDKQHRLKRGGRCEFVSLDTADAAEELFANLPPVLPAPDALFERQWANALLRHALDRLRQAYTEDGKADLFGILEPALTEADTTGLYADCARRLGLQPGAARVALHRLRERYGVWRVPAGRSGPDPRAPGSGGRGTPPPAERVGWLTRTRQLRRCFHPRGSFKIRQAPTYGG